MNKKLAIGYLAFLGLIISVAFIGDANKGKGIDIDAMDTSIRPSDDFYRYGNGMWLKKNPVPAEQSRWGSFDVLAEENNAKIRKVIEEVAEDKAAAEGSVRQKLRDFYLTALDSAKCQQQGIQFILPEIKANNAIVTTKDLSVRLAQLHAMGVGGIFGLYVTRDLKNSNSNIIYVSQGGLGLPDRDYYLNNDERNTKIRTQYLDHVMRMLAFTGDKNSAISAKNILAIETELAKLSMSRVEMRDEEKTYNPYKFSELAKIAKSFDWTNYMSTNGISVDGKIIVNQPDFFKGLNKLIDSVSIDSWRHYLNWNLINTYANELSYEIVKQNFSFYGSVLSGTKEMKPRWKRSLGACDAAIGEIVGQVYVNKYFQADLKVKVNSMVKNILLAYKERISNLDWMSQETKVKALEKLAMFNTKLAYPDNWIDYSKLEVKTDAFVLNMMRAEKFGYQRMISKLGRPVDKSEWQMLPHQVNAYYDPTLNEIVFPAGIMQPPFFYPDADDATNYGALGAVIGHEITHGFDDQGSKYDGYGNLVEWWTATDRELFKKKSKMLVDCFNKYEALPGLFVNGELTLGENIADLGGLSTAYAAFKLNTKSNMAPKIDGFSPDERFFIAFSQVWKQNIKDETLRKRILTDSHSPANFRVIGTLSNMPEFYKTFGVVEGSKMYLSEEVRTKIW